MFITFEGIDGVGKTTQIERLAAELRRQGRTVVLTREPGGTALGEQLRQLVLDASLPLSARTVVLLFLAARSEHVERVIRPALEAGQVVLCDRFCDSTFVYQGLAQGLAVSELQGLRDLNAGATGGLLPDLTVVLDGSPEMLVQRRVQRGVTDRFEKQGLEFQQRLRQGFLALAAAEPGRLQVVNAEQDADAVEKRIAELVGKYFR